MLTHRGYNSFFAFTFRLVRLGLVGWPLLAPAAVRAQPASPKSPPPPRQAPAVQEMFAQHCAKCHGKDGTGNQARALQSNIPDFTVVAWQARRSDPQLRVSILDGKGKDMPPFAGKINDVQARELVAHVRAFSPDKKKDSGPSNGVDDELRRLQREMEDLKKQEPRPPHASRNSFGTMIGWFGRYHAAAVHFPIALLTAAAVAEVLQCATGNLSFSAASRYCVWFGALAAAGAGLLGWCAGDFRFSDANWVLGVHRWLGTATVGCAGLVLTLSELGRRPGRQHTRGCFRATLFLSAVLSLVTGFFGGAVVHGIHHYAWPQ